MLSEAEHHCFLYWLCLLVISSTIIGPDFSSSVCPFLAAALLSVAVVDANPSPINSRNGKYKSHSTTIFNLKLQYADSGSVRYMLEIQPRQVKVLHLITPGWNECNPWSPRSDCKDLVELLPRIFEPPVPKVKMNSGVSCAIAVFEYLQSNGLIKNYDKFVIEPSFRTWKCTPELGTQFDVRDLDDLEKNSDNFKVGIHMYIQELNFKSPFWRKTSSVLAIDAQNEEGGTDNGDLFSLHGKGIQQLE
ncbi:hypothetical protein F5876DRAFT_62125 [Lentinula aff. lateritia]|uniref:Uncharacterized protein n=1 Tax=Lentinula aff. lateritia TaxID=2804960 RepID=A0ACC1UC41_9AGAR|nr:hypothetical protein F5876DRAFT_62125 [Lentinula aff. lateritia]